jgi:flagellar export protein FliJ
MRPFRFRLKTLLRLREAARDERRLALAQALRADAVLEERLTDLRGELSQMRREAREHLIAGTLDVDRLLDRQRFELVLRAEQATVEQQRQLLVREIENRRQALIEADREVRVLEKARNLYQERHQAEAERQELAALDETALRPYQRREDVPWVD